LPRVSSSGAASGRTECSIAASRVCHLDISISFHRAIPYAAGDRCHSHCLIRLELLRRLLLLLLLLLLLPLVLLPHVIGGKMPAFDSRVRRSGLKLKKSQCDSATMLAWCRMRRAGHCLLRWRWRKGARLSRTASENALAAGFRGAAAAVFWKWRWNGRVKPKRFPMML